MSSVDILVPDLPESVADARVAVWHKNPGESVQRDEILVEIETDKVVLEVSAPEDGVLETLLENEGATVTARQVLGSLRSRGCTAEAITEKKSHNQENTLAQRHFSGLEEKINSTPSPTIHYLLDEYDLQSGTLKGSDVGGHITHEDVEEYLTDHQRTRTTFGKRSEKRVPMTPLRKRVAERLLKAKDSTAALTTFNEVNMQPVINLREQYGEVFEKRHCIRLGFMSFYIKSVLEALKRFPEVNASIDGEDIVYHNYFDVSIAVSTHRGLVTPILKDIDTLSMADIEKRIKELAIKGRDGKLKVEELTGGNFTITNGGVFGSLVSTPIINLPQSAILGIHAIKDRPMAVNGQVVILPMMYLALSYDHRIIDGKESVNFLVTVKEILEDPIRLLLDV